MSSQVFTNSKEGSVFGGILLIAGSCIGAGMLALPVITGIAGFIPSLIWFFFAWVFMAVTGLLLLEANLALGYNLSLVSLAEKTLGKRGKILCWVLFLFLFYCLSIAYIAASGDLLKGIFEDFLHIKIPNWFGSLLFTVIFGVVIAKGTKTVDYLNRFLMVGLICAYVTLVALGSFQVHLEFLEDRFWKYSLASIPVLIISFGYHNMIPSLAMYFKGDLKRLRTTVIIGSVIPLLIYLIWQIVMLGMIPSENRGQLLIALHQGKEATEVLRQLMKHSAITGIAQTFALFAIVTSFLAQSLSLVDFLGDGLKIPKEKWGRFFLILLTLIPPYIFAFLYPGIFIRALNLAGGFSAVILFGVMPVLMVWIIRKQQKGKILPLIPIGKGLLSLIFILALAIFFLEVMQELGFSFLPVDIDVTP